MASYVFLLLDPDCRVQRAEVLRATDDTSAMALAMNRARHTRSWGYELWRRGQQIAALHDCSHPPARVAVS